MRKPIVAFAVSLFLSSAAPIAAQQPKLDETLLNRNFRMTLGAGDASIVFTAKVERDTSDTIKINYLAAS